jgi:hypothetical protein
MFTANIKSEIGQVGVETTSHRGFTPEEIAVDCANKIISISTTADPVLRQQAEAFKSGIEQVVLHYMRQAADSQKTTIYNVLLNAGESSLAEQIRRL